MITTPSMQPPPLPRLLSDALDPAALAQEQIWAAQKLDCKAHALCHIPSLAGRQRAVERARQRHGDDYAVNLQARIDYWWQRGIRAQRVADNG